MSMKKNSLAIVSGGIALVIGTMIYLKISYENNQSADKSTSIINEESSNSTVNHSENQITNASPSIVQEVLGASVANDIKNNNTNLDNSIGKSSIIQVPSEVLSSKETKHLVNENKNNSNISEETKKLEQEKKALEEKLKKEIAFNETALKKEQDEKQALVSQTQKLQEEAKKRKEESDKLKAETEELRKALSVKTVSNDKDSKICVSYGPMTIDLKNKFRNILSNNKIVAASFQDRQLPQYEIFWNLGNNKLEALERFEKQKKEGALRDDKFKLTQDNNNNWIVPATTIAGDYSVAETLAKQLSASSLKFGGKWDIREKTGGHYIIFPNVNIIPDSVLKTIDKDLRLNKTFC